MTTATETVDPSEHLDHAEAHDDHGHSHAHGTGYYVVIALILAGLTAVETSTYWIDFGNAFMPVLLIMMCIKFWMVVSFFMHLRTDNRIFAWLFYSGLFLALGVYLVTLLTFRFFDTP